MELAEVLKMLEGQTIVKIHADDWTPDWLTADDSVTIELSNGIKLNTMGEPLEVQFPEE